MGYHYTAQLIGVSLITGLLAGCGTTLQENSETGAHLEAPPADASTNIPEVVSPVPLVTEPQPQEEPDLYSVVAQDVPVRELLFAMARDASINIDVHPNITGQVSINAIDQTLPQILERVSRQVDMRWSFDSNDNLLVEPDVPYWHTYRLDYVNVNRQANTSADVSSSLANVGGDGGGGGGNNTSSTSITQSSTNNFWASLTENLRGLIGDTDNAPAAVPGELVSSIVVNPETGIIAVHASSEEHEQIMSFLQFVQTRSLHQVLIEATVVEVELNDNYQSGVDWATIARNSGEISFVQNLTGANLNGAPTNVLTIDDSGGPDAITATVRLLSQFGDLRVLSSPKLMALNNQAALLRVVDNRVYFTIEVQPGIPPSGVSTGTPPVYTSTLNTVPVGFVMSVTPQIGENDQVTLNVRPTISRIVRFVNDPSPILAENGVVNAVPEIQIREIESVLKIYSGQIAVLGGLMQDSLDSNVDGLPVLSRLPGVRNLFSYRDDAASKTELIVFIRPVVIRQPSLDGDLQDYRRFLPQNGFGFFESSTVNASGSD